MRQIITMIAAMAAMVGLSVTTGHAEVGKAYVSTVTPSERPAHFALVDAAPSVDTLIQRLLDALAKSDAGALHRLRVTEDEYRKFFLPGGTESGKPARAYDDASSEFAWQMLNTNSTYAAASIIKGWGGRKYTVKEVKYLKGRKEYAWYTAYKTVSLTLEDETGKDNELVLGSIADVDGQFKFVSLLGNR